jgi:hypothetical protein
LTELGIRLVTNLIVEKAFGLGKAAGRTNELPFFMICPSMNPNIAKRR